LVSFPDLAACVDLLVKYSDNIVANQADPKYRRIKTSNKVFVERAKSVPGCIEVLKAAGFEEQSEDGDTLLVYPADRTADYLLKLKELLLGPLEVERDIQIFRPSSSGPRVDVPESVYTHTKSELVAEQKKMAEDAELRQTLRTREMRERDELKVCPPFDTCYSHHAGYSSCHLAHVNSTRIVPPQHNKKYKVTRMRIRFPDGLLLQANLAGHETPKAVQELVQFCLEESSHEFKLFTPGGESLEVSASSGEGAGGRTLLDLGFVPSVLLNLRWNDGFKGSRLSQNLLALAQSL